MTGKGRDGKGREGTGSAPKLKLGPQNYFPGAGAGLRRRNETNIAMTPNRKI